MQSQTKKKLASLATAFALTAVPVAESAAKTITFKGQPLSCKTLTQPRQDLTCEFIKYAQTIAYGRDKMSKIDCDATITEGPNAGYTYNQTYEGLNKAAGHVRFIHGKPELSQYILGSAMKKTGTKPSNQDQQKAYQRYLITQSYIDLRRDNKTVEQANQQVSQALRGQLSPQGVEDYIDQTPVIRAWEACLTP